MKSRLVASKRCSFLGTNLKGRILVSTLLAIIVAAAAWAQSAPAVNSTDARKAIEAGYIEWAKARVALDMNTIEKMLAPDFSFQLPDRKLTRQDFIDRMHSLKITRFDTSVLTVNPEAMSGRSSYLRKERSRPRTTMAKRARGTSRWLHGMAGEN